MKKIFLLLPFVLSITGCNYFSTPTPETTSSSPKNEPPKTLVYKEVGSAEKIIRPSVEARGFKLNWQAKGNYILNENDLKNIKGLSLGQALNKFQESFTSRNLAIKKELENRNAQLAHPEYVLIFVCGDTVFVNEFDFNKYNTYRQKLRYGKVEGCAQPQDILIPLDDLKLQHLQNAKSNPVAQQPLATTPTNPQNYQYSPEDEAGEEVDINNLDFGNIVVTQEFIKTLEDETGQKFNLQLYMENQKKRQQQKQQGK